MVEGEAMGGQLTRQEGRRTQLAVQREAARIAKLGDVDCKRIADDERPPSLIARDWGISAAAVARIKARFTDRLPTTGRPTSFDPECAALALQAFSEGVNWRDACLAAGLSLSTAHYWLDTVPAFLEARTRALDSWASAKAAEIDAIADDPNIEPKQKQVMIKSRQWQMERQTAAYRAKGTTPAGGSNITINYLQLLQRAADDVIEG